MKRNQRQFIFLFTALILIFASTRSFAQNLEDRVGALEDYVETFQPTLVDFSQNMQNSIRAYTQDLDNSLTTYTQRLQLEIDERVNQSNNRRVVLNLSSKAFQKFETNVGSFLVAVNRVERLDSNSQYRLYLNIGNINFASFTGFKIRLLWGQKYNPGSQISYENWRNSLKGAEYTFQGTIHKGYWNPVEIDIDVTNSSELAHMEFEMDALSVELQSF